MKGLRAASCHTEFALNAGLRFITPEECFEDAQPDEDFVLWGWNPFSYDHASARTGLRLEVYALVEPRVPAAPDPPALVPPAAPPPTATPHEVILLLGGPASGKTHYYNTHLQPQRYERFVRRLETRFELPPDLRNHSRRAGLPSAAKL